MQAAHVEDLAHRRGQGADDEFHTGALGGARGLDHGAQAGAGDVIEGGKINIRKYLRGSPFDRWVGYLKHLEGQNVDELIEAMRGR